MLANTLHPKSINFTFYLRLVWVERECAYLTNTVRWYFTLLCTSIQIDLLTNLPVGKKMRELTSACYDRWAQNLRGFCISVSHGRIQSCE